MNINRYSYNYDAGTFEPIIYNSAIFEIRLPRRITNADKIKFLRENHILNAFFKNASREKIYNNTEDLITRAFCWELTQEGSEFWSYIHIKYVKWFRENFKK